jgi:CcmD family protein
VNVWSRTRLAATVIVGWIATAALAAQQPPPGFERFETGNAAVEQIPAAPLVIAAYAFVWVALMLYVWSVWRRLVRVEGELTALEHRLKK